ncbi:MAG: PD40 domain-containing protein [Prolixibacteraceae bacterium]|nr:PD40 domain-containing protein [Prolixibacteraceae bacterium]
MNFYIQEDAEKYHVEISSIEGQSIVIQQTAPEISIPVKQWKTLLQKNKGNKLKVDIYLKKSQQWFQYPALSDSIAADSLNPYLVYRLINTQYAYSKDMQLAQRNLENFDESLIWENSSNNEGCFNCHSFSNYNPEKMSLHLRQYNSGTLILDGKELKKLNTKTPYTMSAFGYAASNPDGELMAYSVNIFNEYFTNSTQNLNEVTDQASDIVVYNKKTNTVTTSPKISSKNRENFPSWSPDGKWLYYVSAGEAFDDFDSRYYSMYSLCKIMYDKASNTWGEVDTVFNAEKEGKSITFPRISPDGQYLLFCLIDYGYFSINHRESDLYLMDLTTGEYSRLDINSAENDSYHSWSKNGRWIVFSSKRFNDLYTAPYFSYFDSHGKFHKPFILPQEDPHFYETYLKNFNIPEFVDGKVNLNPLKIRNALYGNGLDVVFDSTVNVDALSGASWIQKHSGQEASPEKHYQVTGQPEPAKK